VLNERKRIYEEGIKENATLTVDLESIRVRVRVPSGKTYTVRVDPDDTAASIRDAVSKKENISSDAYTIKLGKEVIDESLTIFEAGIQQGAYLVFDMSTIEVTIQMPTGKNFKIKVDPDSKVNAIKHIIMKKEGIHTSTFTITLDGEKLNFRKTIYASGITNGSIIIVDINSIRIRVKSPEGKRFAIRVDPDDKVSTIKDAIQQKTKVEGDRYRLIFNSETLSEDDLIF
jgi:hypothetical protein